MSVEERNELISKCLETKEGVDAILRSALSEGTIGKFPEFKGLDWEKLYD